MSLGSLREDTQAALRSVRGNVAFYIFAAIIAAVGIAASTTIFSVSGPLLLKALPFPEPERLVWIDNQGEDGLSAITSRTSNLRDFREQGTTFESLSGYNAFFRQARYNLVTGDRAESLVGVDVAGNFLDVLGVQPERGRNFDHEESLFGGPQAVILTHGFWVRRFGSDPSIVGKTLSLNGEPNEVVGVLPPVIRLCVCFRTGFERRLPASLSDQRGDRQLGNTLTMIGRLRPGATARDAQQDLDTVVAGLQEADPERWGLGARVHPMQERISGSYRTGLLLLCGAAGIIMLIVCVNLSNLLLARAPGRQQEMSVRSALGATAPRLLRQLLLESTVLALAGATLGAGAAWLATRAIATSSSIQIPMLERISVDPVALTFSTFLAVATGLAVGLAPALQLSLGAAGNGLNRGRATSAGRGGNRIREALVVAQVALACALLIFGGLLLRSFQKLLEVDMGFQPTQVVSWQLNSSREFGNLRETTTFYKQIADAALELPGVEAVGLADDLPLGTNRTWGVSSLRAELEDEEGFSVFPHIVDSRYTDAMGIELIAGRNFTYQDDEDSEPVVIFNQTAARAIFGDADPVNQMVRLFDNPTLVVGIVEDVRHRTLDSGSGNEMYLPFTQVGAFQTLELVIQSKLPAETLAPQISQVISRLDPGMPSDEYKSLGTIIEAELSPRKFTFSLLSGFAATAVLLAALGIYGVLSCNVSERIPEIGIRMALGETGRSVGRRVVARTLGLVAVGTLLGVGISVAASSSVRSLLYGISPNDPMTLLVMPLTLLGVGLIAGYMPALRAARTDPVDALERS